VNVKSISSLNQTRKIIAHVHRKHKQRKRLGHKNWCRTKYQIAWSCYVRIPPGRKMDLTYTGKLAWACIALFIWMWCFYTMSCFDKRIIIYKNLNRKELMYISIRWLHDLNAIIFKSHWIKSNIVGKDVVVSNNVASTYKSQLHNMLKMFSISQCSLYQLPGGRVSNKSL
jgi:hypothetical protein